LIKPKVIKTAQISKTADSENKCLFSIIIKKLEETLNIFPMFKTDFCLLFYFYFFFRYFDYIKFTEIIKKIFLKSFVNSI